MKLTDNEKKQVKELFDSEDFEELILIAANGFMKLSGKEMMLDFSDFDAELFDEFKMEKIYYVDDDNYDIVVKGYEDFEYGNYCVGHDKVMNRFEFDIFVLNYFGRLFESEVVNRIETVVKYVNVFRIVTLVFGVFKVDGVYKHCLVPVYKVFHER